MTEFSAEVLPPDEEVDEVDGEAEVVEHLANKHHEHVRRASPLPARGRQEQVTQFVQVARSRQQDEWHDDDAKQARHAQQRALFAREHDARRRRAPGIARDVFHAGGDDEGQDEDGGDDEGDDDVDEREHLHDGLELRVGRAVLRPAAVEAHHARRPHGEVVQQEAGDAQQCDEAEGLADGAMLRRLVQEEVDDEVLHRDADHEPDGHEPRTVGQVHGGLAEALPVHQLQPYHVCPRHPDGHEEDAVAGGEGGQVDVGGHPPHLLRQEHDEGHTVAEDAEAEDDGDDVDHQPHRHLVELAVCVGEVRVRVTGVGGDVISQRCDVSEVCDDVFLASVFRRLHDGNFFS